MYCIFLYSECLFFVERRTRVSQVAKSLKNYTFHPESHSSCLVHQENVKNCHFEACLGVAISLRSFFYFRMKRKIQNKKFRLKNRTSNPSNGLNINIFNQKGPNFEKKCLFQILTQGGRISKGLKLAKNGLRKFQPSSGRISN